jgi:hypothetical protein
MNPTPASYWLNYRAGSDLHERGVVPTRQARHMGHIARFARERQLRRMARKAASRWGCGEFVGERRGAVG